MRDITDLMDHYRVVARSVWNNGFWTEPELRNWDSWDHFEQTKRLLFKALVVARLEEGHCCDVASLPYSIYQVVPATSGPAPILIHRPREGDRNRYWDDPVSEVGASDAELQFLDYFDWNPVGYIDFQYYRVHIATFVSQPHLVGREALLEHFHGRVFAKT